MMDEVIDAIDKILEAIPEAYTHRIKIPSYKKETAVRVILSDWNYENRRVERYGGLHWIYRQWWHLLSEAGKSNKAEKTCILGFESKEAMLREKNASMLLKQGGIVYLQTPPGTLQDIRIVVTDLSTQPQSDLSPSMQQWLKKKYFYVELNECLHALGNTLRPLGEANVSDINVSISNIEDIKKRYPESLTTILSPLYEQLIYYIGNVGKESLDSLRRECRKLQEQVYQEIK